MKSSHYVNLCAIAATLVAGSATHAIDFADVEVTYWTGSGDYEAMMIVDWLDSRSLAFGYRWTEFDDPTDLEMLEAVNAWSDRFYREWVGGMEYQAIFGIGWDYDLDGFAKDDPDDWYEEGWYENGFWSQWVSGDGEAWDWGGGLGTVPLTDGYWVGWSWAPDFVADPPHVPLVPAPGTLTVVLLAGFIRGRARE